MRTPEEERRWRELKEALDITQEGQVREDLFDEYISLCDNKEQMMMYAEEYPTCPEAIVRDLSCTKEEVHTAIKVLTTYKAANQRNFEDSMINNLDNIEIYEFLEMLKCFWED